MKYFKSTLAYLLIAVIFLTYCIHRVINIWRSFPSYGKWLLDEELRFMGVMYTATAITFFVDSYLFITMCVICLFVKSYSVSDGN
jgi:hypothetical protein